MRSKGVRLIAACLLAGAMATSALAQVFSSEFFSDPVAEGWDSVTQYCEPELWNEEGWYYQQLDHDACPGGSQGGHDSYRRSLAPLDGAIEFFVEFSVQTDGDRSEIPYGAPSLLAMGNNAGVIYHVTVARDFVKFARDVDLPIWYVDVEPGVPHTYRIALYPDRYAFYIDAYLIDEGVPEGPFPAHDSLISWRGKSAYLPCENAWAYIRYGRQPEDSIGDYDTDAAITLIDHYFLVDCLTKDGPGIFGGPENDAGPGCQWASFVADPGGNSTADADVDLADFAEFQNLFGG